MCVRSQASCFLVFRIIYSMSTCLSVKPVLAQGRIEARTRAARGEACTRTHILDSQALLGPLGLHLSPPPPPPSPAARETSPRLEPACLRYLKLPDSLCTVKARMGEERLGSALPTTSLWKGLKFQGGWSGEEGAKWASRGKSWRNLEDVCRLLPTGVLQT